MMYRLVLFFLFVASGLQANPDLQVRITADSNPLATIAGCINVLDGEFFFIHDDLISKRAGALHHRHIYDGGSEKFNPLGYGCGGLYAKQLDFYDYKDGHGSVHLSQQEQDFFLFYLKKK